MYTMEKEVIAVADAATEAANYASMYYDVCDDAVFLKDDNSYVRMATREDRIAVYKNQTLQHRLAGKVHKSLDTFDDMLIRNRYDYLQ